MGPLGCGQTETAVELAQRKNGNVYYMLASEFAASCAAEAVGVLKEAWSKASGGVLFISDLDNLYADIHTVAVLDMLHLLIVTTTDVTVLLAGDKTAVMRLHAMNPDLYRHFSHVRVRSLTPEQMAEQLLDIVERSHTPVTATFEKKAIELLRGARGVGNLQNSRVVALLAENALIKTGERTMDSGDIDLSVLKLEPDLEIQDGYKELDSLIGLTEVKKTVKLWLHNTALTERRDKLGLNTSGMGQHMVFKGPVGTAKTTVARIIGNILAQSNILSSGHLVEVHRGDLVTEGNEQTAKRVMDAVKRAIGGVLFIDEAYTLTNEKGVRDAGREAIDTLLKLMEDYREEFVVIVAGYSIQMEEFINSNPGLRSRFVRVVEFPSYTIKELGEILDHLSSLRGFVIERSVQEALAHRLGVTSAQPNFGNGRFMRNILEAAIMRQGSRVTAQSSDLELRTLTKDDFAGAILRSGADIFS
jgi:AAA+ superfamily predicted ATPase